MPVMISLATLCLCLVFTVSLNISMRRMPGHCRGFYIPIQFCLNMRCGYQLVRQMQKPINKKGAMNNSWQPNHRQNVPTLSLHLPHPPPRQSNNTPRIETRTITLTTSHTPYGTAVRVRDRSNGFIHIVQETLLVLICT
jgi:hypothetical protein